MPSASRALSPKARGVLAGVMATLAVPGLVTLLFPPGDALSRQTSGAAP